MSELARAYWELGNQLTGFAVASLIGLLLAAAQSVDLKQGIKKHWRISAGGIALGGILYGGLIVGCYFQEILLDTTHKNLFSTLLVRIVIVMINTLGGFAWVRHVKAT